MRRRNIALTASAGIAAGALGLTSLALPAGAQNPRLPQVSADELVASVMESDPPALAGRVTVHNELGLPALPGTGETGELLSGGDKSLRVWYDGQQRQRLSIPSGNGETTVVDDGNTVWKWDSAQRTVVKHPNSEETEVERPEPSTGAEPGEIAQRLVGKLRETSAVRVDGTASVAGRDAYELVLTPKPDERTKLREVRIAVDAEDRIPLRVEVNANGSSEPALRAGFSELSTGPQDAELFQFTPPENARVRTAEKPDTTKPDTPRSGRSGITSPRIEGDGWDTVVLSRLPEGTMSSPSGRKTDDDEQRGTGSTGPRAMAERVGSPISGSWGHGWVINSSVGSAVLTSDGRVAAGAVPQQVLIEALRDS
ncbi:Outer membrane lipoprotein-sorting protein [Actinopolyspora xinjiangensis]|uniref:Outer membrane lipoprotein-sorting protein n=1 Tax=Actinopolyspora xinjiangensis TaxID=405564 RepID=A0A1H0QUM3_9ACTN|nr:hypothetical protein [Actinopolyspora xinjiangensis]SDP21011.1 Outer membrane lipoprotein-sorting protein [Actinopolyspora xinjiangensis]